MITLLVSANLVQEYTSYAYRLKHQHRNPYRVVTQINHIKAAQRYKDERNKGKPLPPANLIRLVLERCLSQRYAVFVLTVL